MMTSAKRRERWELLLADYRASDLSMRAWCEKSGVTFAQLRYWLRKTKEGARPTGWAAVDIVVDAADQVNTSTALIDCGKSAATQGGIIVRVGAAQIEVRPGFDSGLLSDVLRVLVTAC